MGEHGLEKQPSILYGVADIHRNWYMDKNGIVFHTANLALATAQAKALGSEYWVYRIGLDGTPMPIEDLR